jgi:2-dehydropantoate 2-reductase
MLFATALSDDSMSANFADPARLPVWLALGREVGAVAAKRGITSLGFGEFDPMVFAPGRPEDRQVETIRWLAHYTSQTAKTHSGIWRDLAVRKRKTEVDPQIGIIATLGREVGIATPALETLVALIHDIEEGRRPMAFETLKVLIDTCRSVSTTA